MSVHHLINFTKSNLFFKDSRIENFPVFTYSKLFDYFSLKSEKTILVPNVVYKHTSLTYSGITKKHLVVKSEEHLRYEKLLPKSEIKTHLKGCSVCKNSTINNFEIIKHLCRIMRLK